MKTTVINIGGKFANPNLLLNGFTMGVNISSSDENSVYIGVRQHDNPSGKVFLYSYNGICKGSSQSNLPLVGTKLIDEETVYVYEIIATGGSSRNVYPQVGVTRMDFKVEDGDIRNVYLLISAVKTANRDWLNFNFDQFYFNNTDFNDVSVKSPYTLCKFSIDEFVEKYPNTHVASFECSGDDLVVGNIEKLVAYAPYLTAIQFMGAQGVYGEATILLNAMTAAGVVNKNVNISCNNTKVTLNGSAIGSSKTFHFDENGNWSL